MRVHNPDRVPFAIYRRNRTPTPTGFAEIVRDDFPVLHSPRRVGPCGLGFTAFVSAALLAAHLAFIAAVSCTRRSGDRFSFLFAFFAPDFFASAISAAAAR